MAAGVSDRLWWSRNDRSSYKPSRDMISEKSAMQEICDCCGEVKSDVSIENIGPSLAVKL